MSYFLENARRHLDQGNYGPTLNNILLHLEQSPVLPPPQMEIPDQELREMVASLVSDMRHFETRLWKVEGYPIPEEPASETLSSETSSAPTTGPVLPPSPWFTDRLRPMPMRPTDVRPESQEEILRRITTAIMDCFRSMGFIEPELATSWGDYSSLMLTLLWPTRSGENKDGVRGHVVPDSSIHEPPRQEGEGE